MKKYISITLALAVLLALTAPMFAFGGVTVSTSMKGNDVTITVNDGPNKYTAVVIYMKNKTQTYDVGGYKVEIEYNGSGVKSAKIASAPTAQLSQESQQYVQFIDGEYVIVGVWQLCEHGCCTKSINYTIP